METSRTQADLKIRCNLPLQICLHFNLYLSPIWFFLELSRPLHQDGVLFIEANSQVVFDFLWHSSLLLMFTVEVVRLYVGYVGNTLEKAQHMLAFAFLSLCLQLPNHLFRLTTIQSWSWHSLHLATSSLIAFALLCLQVIFSCWHLRTIFQRIYRTGQYGEGDKCQVVADEAHRHMKSL